MVVKVTFHTYQASTYVCRRALYCLDGLSLITQAPAPSLDLTRENLSLVELTEKYKLKLPHY